MLGGTILLVHHVPEEPDLFYRIRSKACAYFNNPILTATSQFAAVLSKDRLGTQNLSSMASKV